MARERSRSRPLTLAAALAAALAATPAEPIVLGDPQARSSPGDKLDLVVPVTLAPGESIDPRCFSLQSSSGIPPDAGLTISIERSLGSTRLRLRSAVPFPDPAVAFALVAHCSGLGADQRRDFALTLGARPAAATAPPAAPTLQEIATTLVARIGDTLASIARAIFPQEPARDRYLEAMRQANPALAAVGEKDPIAPGTPVALPDLRTYAKNLPRHAAPAPAESRAPRMMASAPRAAPRAAARAPVAPPVAAAPRLAGAPPPPAASRRAPSEGFALKLSGASVDLSRSASINERQRAQLRERLMVLESDDQVAALLALRNSVRQLESRVNELQLKLAGMPSAFPAPKAEPAKPAPPKASAPPPEKVQPPKPAPVAVEPPKPAPPPAKVEPPVAKPAPPPTAKVEPPPAAKPAPTQAAKVEPPPAAKPAPARPAETQPTSWIPEGIDWTRIGLGAGAILLLVIAGYLAARLLRRLRDRPKRATQPAAEPATQVMEEGPIVVAEELAPPEVPAAPDASGRAVISSDAGLATRLAEGDTEAVRRRYIEERFPEIANGTIVLDQPESVVKGARLFYEDGAIPRAVELLQFAIERRPEEIKCWLALFEIFRLEGLKGEYADLAGRFRERHGAGETWRKVQYFGREIDPGNALYRDESFKNLETIGPAAARRGAASEPSFDPVAENWLNAPMDFENEVLANDLRRSLMAGAGVTEGDLVPNPMPALRNVEMFRVA